jgi:lipopolysaccharide transport system permease protein
MTTDAGIRRPSLIIRHLDTNLLAYLWRCLQSVSMIPPLAGKFVLLLQRQTVLGWWWVFIKALVPTLGIAAILQHVPAISSAQIPYILYFTSGMALWTLLPSQLSLGTRALRATKQIHFHTTVPKPIFVVASAVVPAIYATVFVIILALFLLYYAVWKGQNFIALEWYLILLPVPVLAVFVLAVGITLFSSVFFLFARDARMLLSLTVQLWFFFTPIMYGLEILPQKWQLAILYLNPVASQIELFRWCLFGVGRWTIGSFTCSFAIIFLVFLLGTRFQMRSEWVIRELV